MKLCLTLGIGFLLLSFILPGNYAPWFTGGQEFLAFAGGLFILSSLLYIEELKIPYAFLVVLAISCFPIIQYSYGIIYFGGDALISCIYLLGFFSMLFSGYNLNNNNILHPQLIYWISGALLISATISTWLAIYQWSLQPSRLWISDFPKNGRPFANLAQPNNLATLLSMGLASVLLFYEKYSLNRLSSTLLALLLLFGVALTQSRTPWLMVIFFIVLWCWKFHHAPRRLTRYQALLWVAIYIIFIVILPYLSQWLLLGETTSVAKRAQSMERLYLYFQFYQSIIKSPLFGYGWQQVSSAQVEITSLFPVAIYTQYTHNILLDIIIWNGPIVGVLVIFIVSFYVFKVSFLARSSENMFVVMAVGFCLLHSMLEYPHAYAYFLLTVGFLVGALQADFPCKTWSIPRGFLLVFLVGSVGLYTLIWKEYRIIEEDYRLMRFEKNRVGTLKAENPAPDVMLLTQLKTLTKYSRLPATTNMSTSDINELSNFSKRFPSPDNMSKYAQALALNKQFEAAYQQHMLIQGLHGDKALIKSIHEMEALADQYMEISPLLNRLYEINLNK